MFQNWKIAAPIVGAAVVIAGVAWVGAREAQAAVEVVVYKSPTCGCCSKWVEHLEENGFTVTTQDMNDLRAVKINFGITSELMSCHTAVVDGYTIEGHVPAEAIRRLLAERPEVAGLAVPGMPMGSPGMEGSRKDPYDVLAFDRAGNTSVYAKY